MWDSLQSTNRPAARSIITMNIADQINMCGMLSFCGCFARRVKPICDDVARGQGAAELSFLVGKSLIPLAPLLCMGLFFEFCWPLTKACGRNDISLSAGAVPVRLPRETDLTGD
ncbi:hypothetical protein [Bradyrhizobium sp. SUTN9-2]|uniref:hypothetical protein n=1 Tax=Bradyrhizobium sp. SUTN9-2 TaxID=1167456 RepID=UPI000D644A46|nr:hypothetical protein [Bradyrhizobium sp. SUTN9-2]